MKIVKINPNQKEDLIYEKAFKLFNEKVFFIGDDKISYSSIKAFFNYFENEGQEPCLIVFGARSDLTSFENSSKKGWLKKLIDYGFPIRKILIVGARNFEKNEKEYIHKNIRSISIEELMFDLENKTDAIMEFGYGKKVYVSIDMNVVDPAYAPGVNFAEPGGLSSREFLYIAKRLSKMKNLRGVQLVGINTEKDINGITSRLGNKIVGAFG